MKTRLKIFSIFFLVIYTISCSRKATDYKSFLNGKERVYPGSVTNVNVLPGKNRVMLTWNPSPDPSIIKYVVYWNNFADSTIVEATSHDPKDLVKCLIPDLQEYTYAFFINSFDAAGNKSVQTQVNNVRIYGDIYALNLFNRPVDIEEPFLLTDGDKNVQLKFLTPDTININTIIKYTNTEGALISRFLAPTQTSIQIDNYKFGTPVSYQSSYIPKTGAIDTFWTNAADIFPSIYKIVMCDKSQFNEVTFPYDMGIYESGTRVSKLWDGNNTVRGYPDIYHSDDPGGSTTMPRSLSFDMGAVYNNLAMIEEIGRNCCNNPVDFEVWGIADTTNATPGLPSNDPNWKTSMQNKGWTMLTEAIRADDGQAAMKFNFIDNPPPVRFILIRVIKTATNSSSVNMSQLTFWYKSTQ